jgi:hypothetical protein
VKDLERIRVSKSWTERLALARGRLTGHRLEHWLEHAISAWRIFNSDIPNGSLSVRDLTKDMLLGFGADLARAAADGNSKLFRDFADAVDLRKSHVPFEDKLRAEIIRYCVPPTGSFTLREILAHLTARAVIRLGKPGPALTDEIANHKRHIRRVCRDLGIRVVGTPGRPKTRTKRPLK